MSLVLWIIPAKGDSIFNAHQKNNRRRCAYLGTHPNPNNIGNLERWILFDTYPLVSSTHWKNGRSSCILITVITRRSSYNCVLYIYLLRSSIYNNMPNLEMRWLSGGKVWLPLLRVWWVVLPWKISPLGNAAGSRWICGWWMLCWSWHRRHEALPRHVQKIVPGKSYIHPPKINIDSNGLENVSPFQYGYFNLGMLNFRWDPFLQSIFFTDPIWPDFGAPHRRKGISWELEVVEVPGRGFPVLNNISMEFEKGDTWSCTKNQMGFFWTTWIGGCFVLNRCCWVNVYCTSFLL